MAHFAIGILVSQCKVSNQRSVGCRFCPPVGNSVGLAKSFCCLCCSLIICLFIVNIKRSGFYSGGRVLNVANLALGLPSCVLKEISGPE